MNRKVRLNASHKGGSDPPWCVRGFIFVTKLNMKGKLRDE